MSNFLSVPKLFLLIWVCIGLSRVFMISNPLSPTKSLFPFPSCLICSLPNWPETVLSPSPAQLIWTPGQRISLLLAIPQVWGS